MADFRVELQAEYRPVLVANRGRGACIRGSQRHKIAAGGLDLIAMAHPYDGFLRQLGEKAVGFQNSALSPAEFPEALRLDFPAHEMAGQLHAVTNPQHWYAELENLRIK